tara:strand:+ start:942 stop:1265 length:324 start_codon:yes stop_codon:yes gene_type:complete
MIWTIRKEEKYQLYSPLFSKEKELNNALLELQNSENKIVDMSSLTISDSSIELLAKVYEHHLSLHISLIVVVSSFENMDRLEEHFVVVPSISEAIDYIYMEELERNV